MFKCEHHDEQGILVFFGYQIDFSATFEYLNRFPFIMTPISIAEVKKNIIKILLEKFNSSATINAKNLECNDDDEST